MKYEDIKQAGGLAEQREAAAEALALLASAPDLSKSRIEVVVGDGRRTVYLGAADSGVLTAFLEGLTQGAETALVDLGVDRPEAAKV